MVEEVDGVNISSHRVKKALPRASFFVFFPSEKLPTDSVDNSVNKDGGKTNIEGKLIT